MRERKRMRAAAHGSHCRTAVNTCQRTPRVKASTRVSDGSRGTRMTRGISWRGARERKKSARERGGGEPAARAGGAADSAAPAPTAQHARL
eukprot:1551753-Rhodomonas_salina.1